MAAGVLSYNPKTRAVCVETLTGYKVMAWPWTDMERENTVYYPIRPRVRCHSAKVRGCGAFPCPALSCHTLSVRRP
eukprot:4523776-Prorocentrum_lima.AAC.1